MRRREEGFANEDFFYDIFVRDPNKRTKIKSTFLSHLAHFNTAYIHRPHRPFLLWGNNTYAVRKIDNGITSYASYMHMYGICVEFVHVFLFFNNKIGMRLIALKKSLRSFMHCWRSSRCSWPPPHRRRGNPRRRSRFPMRPRRTAHRRPDREISWTKS